MQAGTEVLGTGSRQASVYESLENIQVLCSALKMAQVINTAKPL